MSASGRGHGAIAGRTSTRRPALVCGLRRLDDLRQRLSMTMDPSGSLQGARRNRWACGTPYLPAGAILIAGRPGLGRLNVLVLLFFWNAVKFAWMAVLAPVMWLSGRR